LRGRSNAWSGRCAKKLKRSNPGSSGPFSRSDDDADQPHPE
jgi:hypothetical protein